MTLDSGLLFWHVHVRNNLQPDSDTKSNPNHNPNQDTNTKLHAKVNIQ